MCKKLAKNEEKPCPEINGRAICYISHNVSIKEAGELGLSKVLSTTYIYVRENE